MDSLEFAKKVYCGSLRSLMAHTIRAVENDFRENDLGLDVLITHTDLGNLHGALNTRLSGRQILKVSPVARVTALIFIHEKASKELARFTIAHEIYHLLLELKRWMEDSREEEKRDWPQLLMTPEMESECNRFAQALCFLHDSKLYRDEENREKNVYFCSELFESEITTGDDGKPSLPAKLALGNGIPYWKLPDPELVGEVFPWKPIVR
jgi:hypothetical protein